MCMIAYRPEGTGNIPNAVIDAAMNRHGDGFGIAYRTFDEAGTPTLVSERFGPSQRKPFRKALKRVDRSGTEYVAHFRWATHGPKAASHAHPYEYTDPDPSVGKVLVFHNGVIDIRTTAEESDTQVFVRDVLATLPSRWWTSPALRYLVTAAIDWSKLTLMTATETVNLHESRGEWDGGLWYSSAHKPVQKYEWSGGTSVTSTGTPRKWVNGWTDTDGVWHRGGYADDPATGTATGLTSTGTLPTGKAQDGVRPVTATSLVPYRSTDAARSAAALGLMDEADAAPETGLRHMGHALTSIRDLPLDHDEDYEDAVICDSCGTIGSVFVIDGRHYVDMGHLLPDESEDLLPLDACDTGLVTGREVDDMRVRIAAALN